MKLTKWSTLLTMAAALTLFAGCKPGAADSDTKSLDELSGARDANKAAGCSGNFDAASFKAEYPALTAAYDQNIQRADQSVAVESTLSAVPNGMKAIFLGLGYKLVFTNDMATACGSANVEMSAVLRQGVASCATSKLVKNEDGEDTEEVTLYLSSDAATISKSTVLAFMGVISKKLGKVDVDLQGEVTLLEDESSEMEDFRSEFAMSVLHEGIKNDPNSFALIKDMLPADQNFYVQDLSIDQRAQIFAAHRDANPAAAALVTSEIFDNAADSVYCNRATRDSFVTKYTSSARMWADSIHADITDGNSFGLTSGDAVEEGMNLWGFRHRPLRRFQPVRNAFRLRNNQMATNLAQTGFRRPRLAGFRRGWDGSGNWYQPPAWGSGQRLGWRWRN